MSARRQVPGNPLPLMLRIARELLVGAAAFGLLLSFSVRATEAAPVEKPGRVPEVYPAAAALLKTVQTAKKEVLLAAPGFNAAAVEKIMAHRSAGKTFANLTELQDVTGMSIVDIETALGPYQEIERDRALESARKPVPEPGQRLGGPAGRLQVTPQENQQGPIGNVRPGYYAKLPGYEDLDKIDPVKRTEFLERINRELCTCGCQNETLAYCLVNDPGCPVVKALVKKIYDDIMTKPPR